MNVLIYGGGAVGLGIATALIKSGCKVDIAARGKAVELLKKHGIERRGIFGSFHYKPDFFGVYSSIKEIEDKHYDYILTAVKSND